jgi:hypothetical protein
VNGISPNNPLQAPPDSSPVRRSAGCAQVHGGSPPKRNPDGRGEKTCDGAGPSVGKHTVFVLASDGQPLTPTTCARARRLLRSRVARKRWSKFGTFGIQMIEDTRQEIPATSLGVDHGAKFEGYAVVCGQENVLAVQLNLPDKRQIVRKLEQRRRLRHARRFRHCRRRPARVANRRSKGFLAPSQGAIVNSRLKLLRALFDCYPIGAIGWEEVRFNHGAHRWGANFSTVEIGKARILAFFAQQGAIVSAFSGFQTREIRRKYGYRKSKKKTEDKFEAHCSDALALACEVCPNAHVEPGRFLVVDDTYRPVRRQLHDTQPGPGGVRALYSRGTVLGLRKGLLIGTTRGRTGRLCGEDRRGYRYHDASGKRQSTRRLAWISARFVVNSGRKGLSAH